MAFAPLHGLSSSLPLPFSTSYSSTCPLRLVSKATISMNLFLNKFAHQRPLLSLTYIIYTFSFLSYISCHILFCITANCIYVLFSLLDCKVLWSVTIFTLSLLEYHMPQCFPYYRCSINIY